MQAPSVIDSCLHLQGSERCMNVGPGISQNVATLGRCMGATHFKLDPHFTVYLALIYLRQIWVRPSTGPPLLSAAIA